MGFDTSKEVFIKGSDTVVILYEVTQDHSLVIYFEMNPLKVEFFDCETYITTIDDLVVSLLEGINYDQVVDSSQGNNHDIKEN